MEELSSFYSSVSFLLLCHIEELSSKHSNGRMLDGGEINDIICITHIRSVRQLHHQTAFASGWNSCIRVDALQRSPHCHLAGRLLCSRHQYYASHCMLPSNRSFTVSSCSVDILLSTNILPLCRRLAAVFSKQWF